MSDVIFDIQRLKPLVLGKVQLAEVSVIECFETDGGVNYRSDRLILF
jgi:hypothetical protein